MGMENLEHILRMGNYTQKHFIRTVKRKNILSIIKMAR